MIVFLDFMMRNVKAICMHGNCQSKEQNCIDIPKRIVRGTSEKKLKKIRIMKAPIGLHVVPSPSYPGLHTHFASGSSCWQDALGSQMSTSKQDISARRKKNRIVVLLLTYLRAPFMIRTFPQEKYYGMQKHRKAR